MRLITREYKHWRFKYELMRFGILLIVVSLFWIGIELYSTYSSTDIEEDYSAYTQPLNPALDLDVLESLSRRLETPEDFSIVLPDASPTPQPVVRSTPRPTPPQSVSSSAGVLATQSGVFE